MLLATDIATPGERAAANAAVAWGADAARLAGWVRASLDNQSVDLIEATLGPPHARAALVALYEGTDTLVQSAIDLADGVTALAVLARIQARDPLGGDDARLTGPWQQRLPPRIARFRVEDAAVKVASSSDHLVNAHLRIAWEANAATQEEMISCGFDPSEESPEFWSSCEQPEACSARLASPFDQNRHSRSYRPASRRRWAPTTRRTITAMCSLPAVITALVRLVRRPKSPSTRAVGVLHEGRRRRPRPDERP
jgi:hypothetical protein